MAASIPLQGAVDLTLPRPQAGRVGRLDSTSEKVRRVMKRIAAGYPESMRDDQLDDVERVAFHVEQVHRPGARLADLGGGIGLFSPACAALGMRTWLVDDFQDSVNHEHPIDELGIHAGYGVRVVASDVRHWGEHFADESLDVVTSFDSLAHWHHSPRPVFQQAFRVLVPGGTLFVGAPNAVNLRKRIAVPLGRSNWSHFDDWFGPDEFRGHVREPVMGDLLRMMKLLGFETKCVWGRNWAGYMRGGARRLLTRIIDMPLRAFPTLCADLYVLAVKPG